MPQNSPFDPLKDAAKYVRAFRDKPFVVKIGGDILADGALRKSVWHDDERDCELESSAS